MPRTRKRQQSEIVIESLPDMIQAGWQDFRDFNENNSIPEGLVDPAFQEKLREILREHADVTKAIFGAGVMFSLQLLSDMARTTRDEADLEHMMQHHGNDPKIPRA